MISAELSGNSPEPSAVLTFPPVTAVRSTLPNGLNVIVQEDHSAPVASVQAWVATGSIDEDAHLGSGLSHLLEHMLFKGTETRPANAIAQSIQDVGGYINAYTSFDRTVYWIDVPRAGVETAIDLLADATMNSTLPRDEFIKEQEVIRREFAMGFDDPDRMIGQLMFATAYQRHPYGLPVIGHLDIFNQLTRDEVMAYYKARYVPNNITFIVVGDVETAAVRRQLEEAFAKFPARSLQPVYRPGEPPQLGRREVHQDFKTELTRLALAWHIPRVTHPDVPALDLLSTVLGAGRSSRLYLRVREAGLAHSVSAFSYTPGEPGIFGIDATLDPENREAVQELILQLVEELKTGMATTQELVKARKMSVAEHLGQLTTMRGQASDLGSNWFFTRNLDFSRDYLDALQRVTLEDLQRVARTYLVDRNLTLASLDPEGALDHTRTRPVPSPVGEIQQFTLENGLRLLVREDPRLPLVAISAVFRAGLLAETPATSGITRLTAKMLAKGTTNRTAEEIADELESVGGALSIESGNNSFTLHLDVTQPDLALGLDLLSDILLHATLPEAAVVREKEIQLARIKEDDEHLTTVARNAMREALFRDHPYGLRGNGTPESVARLTREDLVAFRDRHLVARNGVIAIFGNVRAAEVRALCEKALAALPPGDLALQKLPPPPPPLETAMVECLKEKAQAVLMAGYRGADLFSPDRPALELINEACSDLGSRFFVRIREEMGLAYFVGSTQLQGLAPGLFAFYLGTDPQKIEPVRAALLDEIRKLAEDGLTAEELARAKKKFIGQQQISNQSNETFGYISALDELYGLGFDHHQKLEREIEAVTLAQVREVAARYFRQQPHVIAVVRPPAAGAAASEE